MQVARASTSNRPVKRKKSPADVLRTAHTSSTEPLRTCVRDALENYFAHLEGHACNGLYRLVMSEVEAPLLQTVLEYAEGNQTLAAEMLGLNRGTLRKKLKEHGL